MEFSFVKIPVKWIVDVEMLAGNVDSAAIADYPTLARVGEVNTIKR